MWTWFLTNGHLKAEMYTHFFMRKKNTSFEISFKRFPIHIDIFNGTKIPFGVIPFPPPKPQPVTKFSAQNYCKELPTRKNVPPLFWNKLVWLMTLSVLETLRHEIELNCFSLDSNGNIRAAASKKIYFLMKFCK